jgi:hypothetical protein
MWQLEFVLLLAVKVSLGPHPAGWWKEVTNESPATCANLEERGSFQGSVLSLTDDSRRISWLAQPGQQGSPDNLPVLGPFREKMEWFFQLLSPWMQKSCPPLQRLAFSGKLLYRAKTHEEAYEFLASRLRSSVILQKPYPDDFAYQVNRRKHSETEGLQVELNRMARWSKMSVALFSEPSGAPLRWLDSCYAALDLDINTAPETTSLPQHLLPHLFRELVQRAIEIAESGDVAK